MSFKYTTIPAQEKEMVTVGRGTKTAQEQETLLWVDEKGEIIEPVFADYFPSLRPMKCFHDKLFTVDGIIDDKAGLKSEIYGLICRYVTSNVARKIDMLLQVIKLKNLSLSRERK